jgi:hypothetical protein
VNVVTLHHDKPVTPANLVWENPPEKARHGKHAEFAQALRTRPGQWAVFTTVDPGQKRRGWAAANSINSGRLIDFPKDEFQAVTRSTDGTTRVYVRALAANLAAVTA